MPLKVKWRLGAVPKAYELIIKERLLMFSKPKIRILRNLFGGCGFVGAGVGLWVVWPFVDFDLFVGGLSLRQVFVLWDERDDFSRVSLVDLLIQK